MDKQHKISFCTTCKGRLSHLKETLPLNLKNNEGYENVEFVILDYGSEDGLGDWIRKEYLAEINSGKIRYARFDPKDAPYFRMAHAKNMAHRLATGDILCNLDADNITGPGFADWLNREFSANPNIYVRMDKLTQDKKRVAIALRDVSGRARIKAKTVFGVQCEKPPADLMDSSLGGAWGRIAIMRDNFMRLNGYDELRYKGAWGHEDNDFAIRARLAGVKPVALPYGELGSVLRHTDEARTELLAPEDKVASDDLLASYRKMRERPLWKKAHGRISMALHPDEGLKPSSPVANLDGNFGCGRLTLNFQEEKILEPVQQSMAARLKGVEAPQTVIGGNR